MMATSGMQAADQPPGVQASTEERDRSEATGASSMLAPPPHSSEADIAVTRDQAGPEEPASYQPVAGTTLSEKLNFIKTHKLAGNKPVYVTTGGGVNGAGAIVRPATASSGTSSTASGARWVQPSGPRRPGEGTENEEQGIIHAEKQPEGGVQLRITLLAAGFVIGPAGATVREVMRVTGCDIKSWTDSTGKVHAPGQPRRPCRVFIIEGEDEQVAAAIDIVTAAVDRYKELCEGRCQGQSVPRVQKVMGVEFTYQPPPRNVVPFAASLKGNVTRAPSRGLELPGVRGADGMLSMLPAYLVPMPGAYMSPGSPAGAGMPYPMYMPQLGSGFENDLSGDVGNTGMAATDVYGSSAGGVFDAGSGAAGLRMPGAASGATPATSAWSSLPNPYTTYPAGVDPASMMAYMSIMMPASPAQRFPGMDPNAPLAMPFGTNLPSSSPMAPAPPAMPGAFPAAPGHTSLRSSSSPQGPGAAMNPYLATGAAAGPMGGEAVPSYLVGSGLAAPTAAAGSNPYLDPYGRGAAYPGSQQPHGAHGKSGPSSGGLEMAYPESMYSTSALGATQQGMFGHPMALGPTPMSPYMAAQPMPLGWYPHPHSPAGMHMPMMMGPGPVPGPALTVQTSSHAAAMGGATGHGGSGPRRHASGSPPSHTSPTAGGGQVASPSRLNPKAQPWGSGGSSGGRSMGGHAEPRGSSGRSGMPAMTGDPSHDAAVKAASAALAGTGAAAAAGADKPGSSSNGLSPSSADVVVRVVPKMVQLGPEDEATSPLGPPLTYSKTPKRPSASVGGGSTGSTGAAGQRYVTPGGAEVLTLRGPGTDASGSPLTIEFSSPPSSSLHSEGSGHPGAYKPGEGHMGMRGSSGGGSSGRTSGLPLGVLHAHDSPSLVSSEDPLVSPTRFSSRGSRSTRRNPMCDPPSLPDSAGSVSTTAEALRELPHLVDQMSLGPHHGSAGNA